MPRLLKAQIQSVYMYIMIKKQSHIMQMRHYRNEIWILL